MLVTETSSKYSPCDGRLLFSRQTRWVNSWMFTPVLREKKCACQIVFWCCAFRHTFVSNISILLWQTYTVKYKIQCRHKWLSLCCFCDYECVLFFFHGSVWPVCVTGPLLLASHQPGAPELQSCIICQGWRMLQLLRFYVSKSDILTWCYLSQRLLGIKDWVSCFC